MSNKLRAEKTTNSDCVKRRLSKSRYRRRAATRVASHTIFKVSTELRDDFNGQFMVHEIGYSDKLDMWGSTVLC